MSRDGALLFVIIKNMREANSTKRSFAMEDSFLWIATLLNKLNLQDDVKNIIMIVSLLI